MVPRWFEFAIPTWHTHDAAQFARCKPFIASGAAGNCGKTRSARNHCCCWVGSSATSADCPVRGEWIAVDGALVEWLRLDHQSAIIGTIFSELVQERPS